MSDTESCGGEAVPEGVEVKLTEEDIPGASLSEPLETHDSRTEMVVVATNILEQSSTYFTVCLLINSCTDN